MPDFCIVLTTTGSAKEATRIAGALVDDRLAACVNVIPRIESTYYWEGKRCREKEWLLIIKTRTERIAALKVRLQSLHSYACPELIVLPITEGLTPYLDWVRMNT